MHDCCLNMLGLRTADDRGGLKRGRCRQAPVLIAILIILNLSIIAYSPSVAHGAVWDASLGDTVYYGRYSQVPVSNSGLRHRIWMSGERINNEYVSLDGITYRYVNDTYYYMSPIAWRVIADEGDVLLLLSDKVLEERAFGGDLWNDSGIRSWLNSSFLDTAFTEEEREFIPASDNLFLYRTYEDWRTGKQSEYSVSTEQVFLLDRADIQSGVLENAGVSVVAHATPFLNSGEAAFRWWLRGDAGFSYGNRVTDFVTADGTISSYYLTYGRGVRPVIRVEKDAPGLSANQPPLPKGYALGRSAIQRKNVVVDDCVWDDTWLAASSNKYNHELSKTLSVLASAAYDSDAAEIDLGWLGCSDESIVQRFPSASEYERGIDRVAYSIGSKRLDDGSTAVFVLVRGTPKNIEWESNFNVADSEYPNQRGNHEGFDAANSILFNELLDYLNQRGIDPSSAKFVVTGHSRGAAVANLLGHDLDAGVMSLMGKSSKPENTYVYTYATPRCTTDKTAHDAVHDNIFNIVNGEDIVPRVPLRVWGFERYGQTKVLPSKSAHKSGYKAQYANMRTRFQGLTRTEYLPYREGSRTVLGFENALADGVPTTWNYLNDELWYYYPVVSFGITFYIAAGGYSVSEAFHSIGAMLGDKGAPVKSSPDIPIVKVLASLADTKPKMTAKLLAVLFDEAFDPTSFMGHPASVPIATYDTAYFLNAIGDNFYHAHAPETYMSWLFEGNEDMFLSESTLTKVKCPVDVEVYDSEETLVCRIVNDVVDKDVMSSPDGLAASVEDGVKCIDVPSDQNYRIELSATDGGTMDVCCAELDSEGYSVSQVAYANLPLAKGRRYDMGIDRVAEEDEVVADWVRLTSPDDDTLIPDVSVAGDALDSLALSLSVGSGEGVVDGPKNMTPGDQVTVYAVAVGGWFFDGWYEDGRLISKEDVWTFRADGDRSLEARFVEPFFLDADPADDRNHGMEVDWMGRSSISTGWEVAGGREFRGLNNVKRCDFAAFMYRLADLSDNGVRDESPALSDTRVGEVLADVSDCDVRTSHAMEVAWLISTGISKGWANKDGRTVSFKPMANVARQDMAAFLYRYTDIHDNGRQDKSLAMGDQAVAFSDVHHGDVGNHADEVEWLASVGVTKGWGPNGGKYEFRGLKNVARQDMAAFMYRLNEYLL